MINQLITQLDYSVCAEISLMIFAAVFVAVSVRALLTSRDVSAAQARTVFDEHASWRGMEKPASGGEQAEVGRGERRGSGAQNEGAVR